MKAGDIVRIKSGGPKLTVAGHFDDGDLLCVWFIGECYRTEKIARDALKLDDSAASEPGGPDDDDSARSQHFAEFFRLLAERVESGSEESLIHQILFWTPVFCDGHVPQDAKFQGAATIILSQGVSKEMLAERLYREWLRRGEVVQKL